MPTIGEIKQIPPITWSFVVMLSIGTIIPGLLLVFLFREELFTTIETVKLLFLSMGITLPVWFCNTLLTTFAINDGTKGKDNEEDAIHSLQISGMFGAIISVPPLYIPALVCLFYTIPSNIAFYIGFGVEIVIIAFFIYSFISKK
jgi:hypothetical protein